MAHIVEGFWSELSLATVRGEGVRPKLDALMKYHKIPWAAHEWEDGYALCNISFVLDGFEYEAEGSGCDADDAFEEAAWKLSGLKGQGKPVAVEKTPSVAPEAPPAWDRKRYGCPGNGSGLYAWMMAMQEEFVKEVKDWFYARPEIRPLPRKMVDWEPEHVVTGYHLLVRKFEHMGVKVFLGMPAHERPKPESEKQKERERTRALNEVSLFGPPPKIDEDTEELRASIARFVVDHLRAQMGRKPTYQDIVGWINGLVSAMIDGRAWDGEMADPNRTDLILFEYDRRGMSGRFPVEAGTNYGNFAIIPHVRVLEAIRDELVAFWRRKNDPAFAKLHRYVQESRKGDDFKP